MATIEVTIAPIAIPLVGFTGGYAYPYAVGGGVQFCIGGGGV